MKHIFCNKTALRIVLGVLILANMAMIFFFSSQNATQSGQTSQGVSLFIADFFFPDFAGKSPQEQMVIISRITPTIRNMAHMAEFASLGALTYLLLLTWAGYPLEKGTLALLFSFLYAVIDEFHQRFSDGRAADWKDVALDTTGALLACLTVLGLYYMITARKKRIQQKIAP